MSYIPKHGLVSSPEKRNYIMVLKSNLLSNKINQLIEVHLKQVY